MSTFMYLFRGGAAVAHDLRPADRAAHLKAWRTWMADLSASGRIEPGGHPMQDSGRTVSGSPCVVTARPYADAQERITGTLVVNAQDLDDATTLALGCPIYAHHGTVEIRPILDRAG